MCLVNINLLENNKYHVCQSLLQIIKKQISRLKKYGRELVGIGQIQKRPDNFYT